MATYTRKKRLRLGAAGVAMGAIGLVTLCGARGCGYEDPGLPPHPVEPTQYTIDPSSTDYYTLPPVVNFGSASAPLEGTPCYHAGQERVDPGTGDQIVCRGGTWARG